MCRSRWDAAGSPTCTSHGAEVLVSSDPSCMLHLEGIARREHAGLRIMHIAELLEEATR